MSIEDTHATEAEIAEIFGRDVLHIVSGVTKLSKLPFNSAQAREAESIRKMLLAMADDIRVILIKLADRLHNMRTLQFHRSEAKKKKSPGNPGHLCAHCRPPGHLLDQERTGKLILSVPQSRSLSGYPGPGGQGQGRPRKLCGNRQIIHS
jgi:hypothetical protein